MTRLAWSVFDLLETIHILGGTTTPIELATRLNTTTNTIHARLNRATKNGLLTRTRIDGTTAYTYTISTLGQARLAETFTRMDHGADAIAYSMQRALEAATLMHLTEPKTCAC